MAVIAMATGACSGGVTDGVPTTSGPPVGTTTAPTSTSASADRPAVLPLDDVQPCELVSEPMRAQFGIDRPDAPSATNPQAPVCTFISTSVGSYLVGVVRDQGVDALGRPVAATVGGFPAVEIRQTNFAGLCHYGIDVADGQRLDVEIQRRDLTRTQDEICQDTMLFAEAVLATLRQKLGR